MNDVYLLIGGNLGDRKAYLDEAKRKIGQECGSIFEQSSLYETAAWGKRDQPPFLNQVVRLETSMDPTALLEQILLIEKEMGRERMEKYSERIIDIDILYYGNRVIREQEMTIPHPRIAERRFVLTPLAELWPQLVDPSLCLTMQELLDSCEDDLEVKKYER